MQDYEYHSVQAVRLAKHLRMLPVTVIWVDQNPMSFAVHGKPALHCLLHVNSIAHAQARVHCYQPIPNHRGMVTSVLSVICWRAAGIPSLSQSPCLAMWLHWVSRTLCG